MIESSVNALMTPKAAGGQPAALQGQALAGAPGGLFAGVAGLNFMDLIFARLNAEAQNGNIGGKPQSALSAGVASLFKTPQHKIIGAEDPALADMPLETLMAGVPQLPAETDPVMLESDALTVVDLPADILMPASADPQATPLEAAVNDVLQALLAGLPADSRVVAVKITPGQVNRILKAQGQELATYPPGLIGTNLTPEKLTEIISQIEKLQKAGQDVYALGVIKIVPPETPADSRQAFMPFTLVTAQNIAQNPDEDTGNEDETSTDNSLIGILNALMSNMVAPVTAPEPLNKAAALTPGLPAPGMDEAADAALPPVPANAIESFDNVMDQLKASVTDKPEAALAAVKADKSDNKAAAPHIIQHPFAASGSVDSWSAWQDTFPEGLDWMATGIGQRGIGMNGTAAMASLVTHTQHATAPHPATQMVAASISRLATAGENKVFSLKLDPPELGRIEIRMTFGKDKTLDTRLVVEKPETWMMLQRDSHALERAMQDSGISTDSLNLSFELAQHHENAFAGGEQRNGQNSPDTGADPSAAVTEELEIIETSMTWYVDPATGRQRYDLVV